jgi:DNA-directed RNA polymerase omega subunit
MSNDRQNIRSGLNADLRSIDSIYRMIVVAGLRTRQLVKGAQSKIAPNPNYRKSSSIALEEARRGLVRFRVRNEVKVPPVLPSATQQSTSELTT